MLRKVYHNPLASRQCVSCPSTAPICHCSTGQSCVLTSQSCTSCAVAACITDPVHASSSGVSKGLLGGAIAGAFVFLLLVIGGFAWWRRKVSARNGLAPNREKTAGPVPGSASARGLPAVVVRAPDAIEKPGTPDASGFDPNPFADVASTRSGQSIPIALDGNSLPPHGASPTGTTFTAPARPHRSPDLTLRDESGYLDRPTSTLEPPRPGYAPSQRSGFTVSTMDSTASSAMEALYESPTIVSASSRQVLGAVRAEVVQVGGLSPHGIHQPTHPHSRRSQAGPSPLSSSLAVGRFPTIEEDPFSDRSKRGSSATDQTFGSASATGIPRASAMDLDHAPPRTSPTETQNDRGSSVAGSVSRRTSQDSALSSASRTDSVLASFPFVPPSPLPNTHTRSPLSVVFNHDRQSTSSVHVAEAPSRTLIPPPLPVHLNVAEMNRTASDVVPPSPTFAPESDPLQPTRQRVESTMSRASASSAGLGAFHFQFAPDGEAPLPLPNPAFYNDNTPRNSLNTPSPSVGRPSDDLTTSSFPHDSNSGNSQLPYLPNQKPTHASLDTLELSRDLTANRLSYD